VNQQLRARRLGTNPLASLRDRLAGAVGDPARRRVVLLFAAVLALDSADKATLGAVAAELKPDLHIGNPQLGLLAGATAAVSALATVPMGVLTDRVTRVKLLAGSVALWAGAMGWSAFAGSFDTLLLSRLALGAVLATAGPVIASLVGDYFSPDERGRIYGYILSGDLIGSGFGFLVSGNVAAALSWRFSFGLLALAALPLAWMLHTRLREPARGGAGRLIRHGGDHGAEAGLAERTVRDDDVQPIESLVLDEDPARMPLPRALRYVLSVRTNVVLIFATAAGYFFFSGLRTFGVVFARGHFELSQSVASTLFVLVGVGALLGTLVGGRLADRLMLRGHVNARLWVGIAGFVAAALLLLPGLLVGTLVLALPLYLLGAAAFSLPNPPLDAARLDVMPSQLWGRAEGLRTFVRTCAEAGAPLLFGVVAGALGGNGEAHHASGVMYAFLIGLVPLALNGLILARGLKSYPRDVATAAESNARIARAAA
jgi:predicted MFS family arabinose efflux permease